MGSGYNAAIVCELFWGEHSRSHKLTYEQAIFGMNGIFCGAISRPNMERINVGNFCVSKMRKTICVLIYDNEECIF